MAFCLPLVQARELGNGNDLVSIERPSELGKYLGQQGAACMKCGQAPPDGINIQIQMLKAPVIVLRELDFVAPDAEHPVKGTYFADAWRNATSSG